MVLCVIEEPKIIRQYQCIEEVKLVYEYAQSSKGTRRGQCATYQGSYHYFLLERNTSGLILDYEIYTYCKQRCSFADECARSSLQMHEQGYLNKNYADISGLSDQ